MFQGNEDEDIAAKADRTRLNLKKESNRGRKIIFRKWYWIVIAIVLVIVNIIITTNYKKDKEIINNVAKKASQRVENKVTTINNQINNQSTTQTSSQSTTAVSTEYITTQVINNQCTGVTGSKIVRNNSMAKKTILGSGTFTCGVDIPPGRYVIRAKENSGNFTITDNSNLIVNSILDPTGQNGVQTLTVSIIKGEKINIDGMNAVIFTPASTNERDTLTAGTWIVGVDIAPGRYVATPVNGSGNFVVYNSSGIAVNTILDSTGQNGEENYTLNLTNGEVISISGLNEVKFIKK